MSALKPPPLRVRLIDEAGQLLGNWRTWLQDLQTILGNAPFPLMSYTVAGAPDAAEYEGHIIYVSDEAGGKTLAFSDGVNWRRAQDRNIIS